MNELAFEVKLLFNIAEKHLGIELDSLNVRKKTQELVLGRMVVANILMQGGISKQTLSEHLLQDRTNFYHYEKQHNGFISDRRIYPEYYDLYYMVLDEYEQRSATPFYEERLEKLERLNTLGKSIEVMQEQYNKLSKAV